MHVPHTGAQLVTGYAPLSLLKALFSVERVSKIGLFLYFGNSPFFTNLVRLCVQLQITL